MSYFCEKKSSINQVPRNLESFQRTYHKVSFPRCVRMNWCSSSHEALTRSERCWSETKRLSLRPKRSVRPRWEGRRRAWWMWTCKLWKIFHFKEYPTSYSSIASYFLWKSKAGSWSKSLMSTFAPILFTSGCFLINSQPTCEKKKPRFELWGSASVSVYLWCTRWSRTHFRMSWNLAESKNIRNDCKNLHEKFCRFKTELL